MEVWEKGWLAAAIDGEGSIWIGIRHNRILNKLKRGFGWRPKIQISNTSIEFCKQAQRITQLGRIDTNRRVAISERHKNIAYTWNIESRNIAKVIPDILPYLIIKKKQALLILEFCGLLSQHINTNHNDKRLTEIYNEVKLLNKKGRVIPSDPK